MFTMELVDGVRFRDYVAHSEARLRDALVQLADVLTALHSLGKIHRDVKPSNVLVEADGRVVILDFGLIGDLEHLDVTHQGVALGTPGYMSPEQAADITPLTPATDWYAVGVMLYEALCGRKPFRGPSMQVLLDKQRSDPKPPREHNPDAPADLEELCMKLLARDPRQRPDGAAVLAALGASPSPWTRRIADRVAPEQVALDRTAELAFLSRALDDSRNGPVLVALHGPRGAGRSALLDAFAAKITRQGGVVFTIRIGRREDVPLRGLDQLIDAITRYLSALPDSEVAALLPNDVGWLARMFPTMKRLRAAERPNLSHTGLPDADRAFDAVADLLTAISARYPVAVLLDDAHWGTVVGGRATARLFSQRDAQFLLVVSYADELAGEEVIVQTLRAPNVRDLPLQARLPSTQR
jgi:hypothetical protein